MEQCCVLQNDVIHHTLSHITARHLITRSRAAKFQTSTSRSSFECLTLSQSQILMNSGTLTSTSSQEQHNYFLYICTQTQNDKKLRFALRAAEFGHGHQMVCTLSSKMLQTWPPLKPTHVLQVPSFPPRDGAGKHRHNLIQLKPSTRVSSVVRIFVRGRRIAGAPMRSRRQRAPSTAAKRQWGGCCVLGDWISTSSCCSIMVLSLHARRQIGTLSDASRF